MKAERDGLLSRIADLERERDAYKRAKAENDERFMNERDDARSILASLADRMNTWARENGLREAKRCLSLEDMRNTIDALAHRLAEHRIAREADRFELARLRAAMGGLERDKQRMDYLEEEDYRESCWVDAGCPSGGPISLFRLNLPITREAIDRAMGAALERAEKGEE